MEEVRCPGCRERDAIIAALQRQLTALERRVRDLEARLCQNSSNSSLPPSANPPGAPKTITKAPSGHRTGAQAGHDPHLRLQLRDVLTCLTEAPAARRAGLPAPKLLPGT
jgi:hypothetical protein